MYMKKRLEITVPKACAASWNEMSVQNEGRFCGSCQKEVIDFTSYSDADLQTWFTSGRHQKICGRFSVNQIQRLPRVKSAVLTSKWPVARLAAAFAMVLPFTFPPANAKLVHQPPIAISDSWTHTTTVSNADRKTNDADSIQILKGTVRNGSSREALAGAIVAIKGTQLKTTTDSQGNFQIPYDYKSRPVLSVYLTGYQSFEHSIQSKAGADITVVLTEIVMGEVCIKKKPSLSNRIFSRKKGS